MNEIRNKINEVRSMIKDEICHTLIDIYKKNHSGLLPKWEDDEEIVVTNDEVGTFNLTIKENNTYDEEIDYTTYQIVSFIATLDSYLYFATEDDDEFDCDDIDTDTLFDILCFLNKNK